MHGKFIFKPKKNCPTILNTGTLYLEKNLNIYGKNEKKREGIDKSRGNHMGGIPLLEKNSKSHNFFFKSGIYVK